MGNKLSGKDLIKIGFPKNNSINIALGHKVSSAVRATHVPTGISVVAMDSRSQHQNKKLATERLLQKFKDETVKQFKAEFQAQWMNQLQIQRGNPIRIFEGSDFKKQKQVKNYKQERQRLKREDYFDRD